MKLMVQLFDNRQDHNNGRVILFQGLSNQPIPFHTGMTGSSTGTWTNWESVLLLFSKLFYGFSERILTGINYIR